jgi:hypothetical protein
LKFLAPAASTSQAGPNVDRICSPAMWSFFVGAAESIGYAARTDGVAGCRDRKVIVGE